MSQVISCWAAIYALATKFVKKLKEAKEDGCVYGEEEGAKKVDCP